VNYTAGGERSVGGQSGMRSFSRIESFRFSSFITQARGGEHRDAGIRRESGFCFPDARRCRPDGWYLFCGARFTRRFHVEQWAITSGFNLSGTRVAGVYLFNAAGAV
jgi:hypothetical protein